MTHMGKRTGRLFGHPQICQQKSLQANRITFCQTKLHFVEQKYILYYSVNINQFCLTEIPSVKQNYILSNKSTFCRTQSLNVKQKCILSNIIHISLTELHSVTTELILLTVFNSVEMPMYFARGLESQVNFELLFTLYSLLSLEKYTITFF